MQLQIDTIQEALFDTHQVTLSLLRLDLIHPQISGNKWFKLKLNLEEAQKQHKTTLLSFGGAYSNHLHATAYACKEAGIKAIGVVRGEQTSQLNKTLQDCTDWGMQLHFVSREDYKLRYNNEYIDKLKNVFGDFYFVPEGGNNSLGILGCAEINKSIPTNINLVCLPIGTTATMAGIVSALDTDKKVLGFSALKGAEYLNEELKNTLEQLGHREENYTINHDYHFGGFAKQKPELLSFMKEFYDKHRIELDFVYTAKMMFGIYAMIEKGLIEKGTKILGIHTGGLQGNRSI